VENGPPYDIENLLARLAGMEKELASLKDENTRLKVELARKDKIIAGLQQRLFGSSSEKLDPAQLQLLFDAILMGKAEPSTEQGYGDQAGCSSAASKPARTTRSSTPCLPTAAPKASIPRITWSKSSSGCRTTSPRKKQPR